MGKRSKTATGSLASRPRGVWGFGTGAAALLLTAGLFLLIPYLELLAKPPSRPLAVRTIESVRLPPPPTPPPERIYESRAETRQAPRPSLQPRRANLIPVRTAVNLELVLGDVRGDFDLDFDIAATDLVGELGGMVFELEQVDDPPRALVRLQPVYPPGARMRGIEGEVQVEFVVQPDGTTAGLEVVSSRPGELFVPAALRAIRRWRFRPGTQDGKAVAVRVRQKVTFQVRGAGGPNGW
jgi:protein TonB